MIRRCCLQVVLEAGFFDNSTLLDHLIKDPLPTNRSFILRHISANLTPEEFQPYRSALLRDKSAPVRLTALRLLHQFDPAESVAELELAVLDEDPAVREAARFLLKKSTISMISPEFIARFCKIRRSSIAARFPA